jgi:hypothetical protein
MVILPSNWVSQGSQWVFGVPEALGTMTEELTLIPSSPKYSKFNIFFSLFAG